MMNCHDGGHKIIHGSVFTANLILTLISRRKQQFSSHSRNEPNLLLRSSIQWRELSVMK